MRGEIGKYLGLAHKWITIGSYLLIGRGTCCILGAVFGLHVIGLTENHAWIYCGIPVGIIYGIKIWPKFPKITGFGQREV
jgi:hypothetical protein